MQVGILLGKDLPNDVISFDNIFTLTTYVIMSSSNLNVQARLAHLRASRNPGGASMSSHVFTPLRGGYVRPGTIQPIIYGEELALVTDASLLCLGKIGAGGNVCLKLATECSTEIHIKKKGSLPKGSSLVQLRGEEKGYEIVTLPADDLDRELIESLLAKQDVSWPSEFAKILSNDSKTIGVLEATEDLLKTARKHRSFASPAKKRTTNDILEKIELLGTSQSLIVDISAMSYNEEGEGTSRDFSFEEPSYRTICGDVYDKLEVLAENSRCVNDVVMNLQPFIESHTNPMENLISGLRFEMAAVHGQLGTKANEKRDIPPCLWNAVEAGFGSVLELEAKLENVTAMAAEAHEVAVTLLGEEEDVLRSEEVDGNAFLKNLSGPQIIKGNLYHPSTKSEYHEKKRGGSFPNLGGGYGGGSNNGRHPGGGGNGGGPGDGGGNGGSDPSGSHPLGCDHNDELCSRCMLKFHDIDEKLTAASIRLSNIED